jgi:replicative DNA helicase
MASAAISAGYNALYITMEMSEEKIAERIDANLMDIPISDLVYLNRKMFLDRVEKIKTKAHGKLIIKEYPTSSAHSGHFRSLLQELRVKKDFHPDIIFVDYLNICSSARLKAAASSNSYLYIKAIAEELRALGVEEDVAVVTATQTNRSGFSNSDVELTDTAESFGLPATADLMMAIITNEKFDAMGQYMFKQLKNRYNDPAHKRRFMVGVDKARMRLYDLDESAQNNILIETYQTKDKINSFFDRDREGGGEINWGS